MKRLATAFFALTLGMLCFGTAGVLAQSVIDRAPTTPVLFDFETHEDDTTYWNSNYFVSDDPRSYFNFDVLPGVYGIDPYEGDGAMVLDWGMYADQSWGGSNGLVHSLPDAYMPDSLDRLYDLSDFTHIHVWYNVLQPASRNMTIRFKLHDASLGLGSQPSDETEDWNAEDSNILQSGPAGTWQEWTLPLENLGIGVNPPNNGFTRPGCASGGVPEEGSGCWSGLLGNEELDLDLISGISFEFFAGTGVQTGDSTSTGVVAFDKLYVSGVRYDLVTSFDSGAGGWNNGTGTGTRTVVADAIEGTGAMELDYHVVGSESWGGSTDVQISGGGNWAARTHLSVFYKVTEPVVRGSEGDNARLTFKIIENSAGENEEWHWTTYDVLGDTTGQWQRLLIPLSENALTHPSWVPQGDNTFNPESIIEVQYQVIVDNGQEATGTILFDRMTTYGTRVTDTTAPEAVASLDVIPGAQSNLVSWTDVDGENGETYDLFYSLSEITDLEAEGVYLAAIGIAENTEAFLHDLYAPVSDQNVTYYYAIRPTDQVGLRGPITTTGAVENEALGIPTISLSPPAAFAADGDLGEWSGITPIHLEPGGTLGYIPQTTNNFTIDDAQDLSADIYMAVDDQALYVAMEVVDDVYSPVPQGQNDNRWLYDGAEIYIGLYNELHPRHANAFSSGNEPDYKIYLYQQMARTDGVGDFAPAGENYSWTRTADGYIVEGRFPYEDFAHDGVPAFVPVNGMRIPLDIAIMDNDEPGTQDREGILTYSFDNDDNSYLSPRNWFYNWVGDQIAVGVEPLDGEVPGTFALRQNYPNPFNPSTVIAYDLPASGPVTLSVFNVLGQQVATVVDATQTAGRYEVRFDASHLASGVYLYQLRAGSHVMVRKMLLVR